LSIYESKWNCEFEKNGLELIHTEVGRKNGRPKNEMIAAGIGAAATKLSLCRIPNCIKPNMDVLEIGCGPGLNLYALRFTGANLYGIDVSRKIIDYGAYNVVPNDIDLIYGDFTKYKFDLSFDIIFEIIVFQHLRLADVQSIFNSVKKNLKRNGKFIFQMLRDTSPRVREWGFTEENRPIPCMRGYTVGEVSDMLEEAGLKSIDADIVNRDWFVVEATI
jgi:SAM-dependent methyltransferase